MSNSTNKTLLGIGPVNGVSQLIARLKDELAKLSAREIGLLVAAVLVALFIGVFWIIEQVSAAFSKQSYQISELEQVIEALPVRIEAFARKKARRDIIEQRYLSVEMREGALSRLEGLVNNKAGVSSGYTIKDLPPSDFGRNFEQTNYSVRFSTTNLVALVDFLKDLSDPSSPLMLTRLKVDMNPRGEALMVDLEVSTIAQKQSS